MNSLLHELLDNLSHESDVRQALKTAILTYSWLYLRDDLRTRFIEFKEHLHDPLTVEQLQRLKDMGIEVPPELSGS
jgi:hypothetical protein